MSQIKLTGIPNHLPEKHREVAESFFKLLDWKSKRIIANHYGRDHNTLIATVRRANGKEEIVPFLFRENTLKSPKIEKYNKRDLALVQLLGWHIFSKGTYGNFLYNPNFSYTLSDENILESARRNDIEHLNGNCILALKSQGAKANPEETLDGKESTCDGSMFLLSPYSASKGSTAFFYRSKHNIGELSDGAQCLGCTRAQVYGSPDLRALLSKNLRVTDCPNTDILTTGDDSQTLVFNNKPGETIEHGNELSLRARLWRYLWRWDKQTNHQIRAFLEGKKSRATSAPSNSSVHNPLAPKSKSKKP